MVELRVRPWRPLRGRVAVHHPRTPRRRKRREKGVGPLFLGESRKSLQGSKFQKKGSDPFFWAWGVRRVVALVRAGVSFVVRIRKLHRAVLRAHAKSVVVCHNRGRMGARRLA